MGWLMDRSTTPNLSHILMAVRAGWIGKQCASLYPRCSNPGRPQWTVAPMHDDSLNLPSIGQPPVKVRPPLDFFAFTPTPSTTLLDSTLRPPSSSVRAIPSVKPKVSHPSESSDLRTTTSSSTANKKTSSTTDWVRESVQSDTNGVWDKHSIELGEEEQTTSALLSTSLQVDRNGEAGAPVSNGPADSVKPWGKPSRFSGADDIELSDIEEEDIEEEEEDIEENEEDPNPSTKKPAAHYQEDSILHDLNRNHFVEKPVSENPAKIKDTYEEIQKKKTHRLEMVPNRSLVHPWLSEPVWVPENTWPTKTDGNRLRSDEENEDPGDRHRDRVSFGHEDAVKDVRLFDFAMQYLRDRSA
ncbi:hypothetical protein DAPPUDRAFT_314427 [Daphnia pulex]|uniref:Uncharacterized protein n=1 Tax=Daphnia pulex TaxID=6669 RepID=E9G648_DAPPU|nr:hypothetical protein DAPPUDRAFT_314427 [Daphnia pulex]|eukprot:EFX84874.1 hypothetical protein DAPPUDRAFT_314427 [Daphnia pulex]